MTAPSELVQSYDQFAVIARRLQERADPLLLGIARFVQGRFSSRVKPLESVLSKIEKDAPARPWLEIEDLYAATIVVPNETLVANVEEQVSGVFRIVRAQPPKTRRPEEFVYDDRHLILALRPEPGRDDYQIDELSFELQIKTEMQAAVATISRPLTYKTRWLSWSRARLASRIRATVELVDDLLARLSEIPADTAQVPEERYEDYARLNSIIDLLERTLVHEQLPEDRRRLALTVDSYLKDCRPKQKISDLEALLCSEKYRPIRTASSLSAAGAVFIVLYSSGLLLERPTDPSSLRGNRRYLITSEMIDLCPDLRNIPADRRVNLSLESDTSGQSSSVMNA